MADSKLVLENNSYSVYSIIFTYVFGMLSLSCILIYIRFCCRQSLHPCIPLQVCLYFTWPCLFFSPKVLCMRYHHFCKVNNNCYKQQISTSCWELSRKSTQQTAVKLFTLYKFDTSFLTNPKIYQNDI